MEMPYYLKPHLCSQVCEQEVYLDLDLALDLSRSHPHLEHL